MRMEIIQKSKNVEAERSIDQRKLIQKRIYVPQVLLIECKNDLNIYAPATSYKLSLILNMHNIIPICIEGEGLSPFVDALFIAQLHLKTGTTDVFIASTDPKNSINYEFIHIREYVNNSLKNKNFLIQPDNTPSEDDENNIHDWSIILRSQKSELHQNSLKNNLLTLRPDYNTAYDLLKLINDHQRTQNSKYGAIYVANPYKNINNKEQPNA
jgi:hypothetical protein